MSNMPSARFIQTFSAALAEPLRAQAFSPAYALAGDHYDLEQGSDMQLFGFEVYKFSSFRLERLAERRPQLGLEVLSAHPTFRLRVNGFEVASHRVESNASDDIYRCFPGNDGAVLTMVENFLPFDQRLERATKVVLAHLGNPDDGLTALYACIPAAHDGEHITAWAYAHPLWLGDRTRNTTVDDEVFTAAPPEVVVPVAARLRRVSEAQ